MAAFRGTYSRSYPEETAPRTRQPRNPGMEINPAGERGSLWWMNWNTSCIITKCWKAPCYCCVRDGELIIKVTSDNTPKHALRPGFLSTFVLTGASLVSQMVKRLPAMRETQVWSLGREDPLEKETAIHSSILAWRISWTEEPGRLQSTGCKELDTTELLHFSLSLPLKRPRGITQTFKKERCIICYYNTYQVVEFNPLP